MTAITPITSCTIIGIINGNPVETPARTLREHITALETAANLLGLPAFSEDAGPRIDARSARAYTHAHRWFIDCRHKDGGIVSSYLAGDSITDIDAKQWDAIHGVTVDEFLGGDFDTLRWQPWTCELLRVNPMPVTRDTVLEYAKFVISAGGVFEVNDMELVVA